MTELHLFKLDGIIFRDNPSSFIIKINYNVPLNRLIDENDSKTIISRIKDWVSDEFLKEIEKDRLYYNISATYNLIHDDNGELRLWQGSFQPRNNQLCLVKESTLFQMNHFENEVFIVTRPDNVFENLRIVGLDTKWTISDVKSVIISFESRCSSAHHVLRLNSPIIPANRLRDILSRRYTFFSRLLD